MLDSTNKMGRTEEVKSGTARKRKSRHDSPQFNNTTLERTQAERFLRLLDPSTDAFTFQTFDEEGKDRSLVKILHGTLAQHFDKLAELNEQGAGVYVTVNATDLKGRKAENIKRVRYIFVDLDGAPLKPAKQPKPHIIVESSPKRWHVYWRVADMPLESFRDAQRAIIKRLGSDKSVTDLPRVLRLPGFLHQKGKPFLVRITAADDKLPAYPASAFPADAVPRKTKTRTSNLPPVDIAEVESALDVIPSDGYQVWFEVGAGLRQDLGDEKGFPLFDRWSGKSDKYDKKKVAAKWEGLAKVTEFHVGTVFHHATQHDPNWRKVKQPSRGDVETVCAADIKPKALDWLWPGHLLRGTLELLTGLPGLGKSQVQISLVTCVTTGSPWPDGAKGIKPANVLMLTAEDGLDQTVVPRLKAAGADLTRVHILKCIRTDEKTSRQFLLGEDLEKLEKIMRQVGDVALVTIDPITAYMGGKMDSHKSTEVRSQLGPLKDFSERNNVAISALTHPPKSSSQKAIDQFIGSQAFIAAGRIGHVCTREIADEKETGRVLFSHAKHTNSKAMPTLAYTVAEKYIGMDKNIPINAVYVVWEKDPVEITADEAVRATGGGDKQRGKQQSVQTFLREILKSGEPVPAKDVITAANQHGFTEQQLKDARIKLRVISVQRKGGQGWWWQGRKIDGVY